MTACLLFCVSLYGHEAWYLILKKEHKQQETENTAMRAFGPTREEPTGGRRISFVIYTVRGIYTRIRIYRREKNGSYICAVSEG